MMDDFVQDTTSSSFVNNWVKYIFGRYKIANFIFSLYKNKMTCFAPYKTIIHVK